MANEKVIFKRGPSSALPTTKVAGTILIDTTTGNAYLDDSSTSRIQLKDSTKLPVNGNAASATKWNTARNINGLSIDGTANRTNYGTCSTAAGTAAKVVACTGFALVTGAEITVKFTVTNTAPSPTLNVNSTGAKAIYYRGAAISAGYLAANRTYTFRYNGTQYELVGDINTDSNTTYSAATQSAAGLMSAADKTKLDGIATGANKYTHPTTAGNKHIPAGGSSGQILRWSADGTAVWGNDNNTTYTNFVKSGSGAKAGLVPAPSTTAGTTKYLREDGTWSVPPNTNTDTKVTQNNVTDANDYRILLSNSANDTNETNVAKKSTKLQFNPSTGALYSAGYNRINITDKTVDVNTYTLASGEPHIQRYINITNAGATNITNIPVKNLPFILDVELIRWASATDYITRQTFRNVNSEYERTYSSGTWSAWTKKKFTDTTYTALKNPYAITIQGNGTSLGTYDGSAAKTINITPESIGASATSHTHSYLPLSGGTITSSNFGPLIIKRTTKNFASLRFENSNGVLGSIGMSDVDGDLYKHPSAQTTASYKILDTSNTSFTSTLTSGTKIGTLKIGGTSTDIYCQTNTNTDTKVTQSNITENYDFRLILSNAANDTNETTGVKKSAKFKANPSTGNLTATKFTGSGAGLTSLNASNLSSGTVPIARIPTGTSSASVALGNHTHSYLPLAGGTMTGQIKFNTGTKTSIPVKVVDGDANGQMLVIGGTGGLTLVGGGESAASLEGLVTSEAGLPSPVNASSKISKTTESLILSGDSDVWIMTNCNTIANRKAMVFTSGGHFYPCTTNASSLGTSTYKWANAYATTFHGALDGNASTASSAAKLTTARNIDGVSFNGSASIIHYGTCSTAAATVEKVVDCPGFVILSGAKITVRFSVTNTAANPTLNVNGTGAKPIYYRNAAISAGYLAANRIYTFVYDGAQYELVGDVNTNTDTKVTATNLNVTSSSNYGIIRPLLIAASNANPSNTTGTVGAIPNASTCTTYTGGVNMCGGLYVKTNYWTNGGSGSYCELHVPNGTVNARYLNGIASSASKLNTARTINGVSFDGSNNITLTKCLYSGSGSNKVELTDDWTNYDSLIIICDPYGGATRVTLFHHISNGSGTNIYVRHPFVTYPNPSQNGSTSVSLGNVLTSLSGTNTVGISASDVLMTAKGSTANASAVAYSPKIYEVYGLKYS